MSKFYRAIKDSFLWKAGAIITASPNSYRPIDQTSIWDNTEFNGEEYISARIIENNPDWFEQVYPVNLLTKTIYKIKAEALELINKEYKGENA